VHFYSSPHRVLPVSSPSCSLSPSFSLPPSLPLLSICLSPLRVLSSVPRRFSRRRPSDRAAPRRVVFRIRTRSQNSSPARTAPPGASQPRKTATAGDSDMCVAPVLCPAVVTVAIRRSSLLLCARYTPCARLTCCDRHCCRAAAVTRRSRDCTLRCISSTMPPPAKCCEYLTHCENPI